MLFSILVFAFLATVRVASQLPDAFDTSIFGKKDDDFVRSVGRPSSDRPGKNSLGTSKSCHSCVPVSKCGPLNKIYQKGQTINTEQRQKLRNHFCGWDSRVPNVCCDEYWNTVVASPKISRKPPRKNPKAPPPNFAKCGDNVLNKNSSEPRIVGGGDPATLGAWPWMAALYARVSKNGIPKFKCGGSLIANTWVLTAAHCIPASYSNEQLVHVVLGDLDLNKAVIDEADPIEVKIAEVIMHPQYREKPVYNDIALLRLSEPVEYNIHIQPICLHKGHRFLNDSLFYNGKKPSIAGWGYTNTTEDRVLSSHLLEAEIPVVSMTECKKNYAPYGDNVRIDQAVMMCAGKGGKDACQGDSGGPLMFNDFKAGGIWSQAGIVSFGKGCGEKGFPGVYTRVAAFVEWIEKMTKLKF